jgi:hypothetical protein
MKWHYDAIECGYLDNIKLLLNNKFTHNTRVFTCSAYKVNLDIIKWLFENNFPYDKDVFEYAADYGNLDNIKWFFFIISLMTNKHSHLRL